jgi:hypothetical protein
MDTPESIAERLFEEALDLPREQRSAFLDGVCRDVPELRGRVDALLMENDRLTGFLVDPIFAAAPKAAAPPQTMLWAPGSRVGRYSIEGQLGSGGMGVVYRARDEKLERTVALKMVAPGMLSGAEARRHFRREALALGRLNHPHIAAIYDTGEQDGYDYIVMECVKGESLAARLRTGPMSVRDATAVVVQIAEALEEAHEQGVIHRDLKPANVMLTPKGHVKVLDFGLARMLASADATQSLIETQGLLGTPLYMSPEQALGEPLDSRSDLWSLGVLYYELLAGRPPFDAPSSFAVLQAITTAPAPPLRTARPDAPDEAVQIVTRALQKDPGHRYPSAMAFAQDTSHLLAQLGGPFALHSRSKGRRRWLAACVALILAVIAAVGWIFNRRSAERHWAREEATPQMAQLIDERAPLAAFLVLLRAEKALPDDARLRRMANENTQSVSVSSEPAGATVAIQDYLRPHSAWYPLGVTPLANGSIPKGYFRWKVSKPGVGELIEAPETKATMDFPLAAAQKAPAGMAFSPGGSWKTYEAFLGWLGPYNLPPYFIDRYEVTNRDYQKFVDDGGYASPQFWPAVFHQNGRAISWREAMAQFRDTTGRPGPSTWVAGHYAQRQADFPVSGVSWFEAAAYAAYAAKSLPVLGQWYQAAPPDVAEYAVPASNITGSALAPVGSYTGVGPYGTFDMAGNVREWVANPVDGDLRFILGGSWKSPAYLYTDPEALSPFDRAEGNGFRCVRNLGPLPENATQPYQGVARNFAMYKPVNDAVFRAYELLYTYPKTPLNAEVEGVVKETEDWREEKVSFDAPYKGERMAAYLFLPKREQPPYQTILFFPSARVLFLPPDSSHLGDTEFFDYIVQSGRAVMYPVYENTYERREPSIRYNLPSAGVDDELIIDWYKDAARSLDYLATRSDIDSSRLAYLGVSVGSADGVIFSTLLQNRLRTALLLDGGYFLQKPSPGFDQADFAPRVKIPVLMVNGRYDYTFPVDKAQEPLFAALGTPTDEKSHVVLDTPHDVTAQRPQLVKAVLNWLDRYLGRTQG